MDQIHDTFYSEKEIAIEPDLDLRKSTDKALPAPPKTPKRVMMKYRFSAVFPIAFAVASCVLSILVVVAGQGTDMFNGQYLVALNTSRLGVDASLSGQATTKTVEIADFYYLYLRTVCTGSIVNSTDGVTESVIIERCESYRAVSDRLAAASDTLSSKPPSALPLANVLKYTSKNLNSVREAITAFLIVSLVGAGFAAVSAFPAIVFPHSRLLVFFNMGWTHLASLSAFLGALIATALIISVAAVADVFGKKAGIEVQQGGSVVLFIWLAWLLISLPVFYWGAIWFVDIRRSSILRRRRTDDELGNWRAVGKEMRKDLRGRDQV